MKNNSIIKFLVAYFIRTIISGMIGFSYNLFYNEFNLIHLIIDLAIWAIAYGGVDLAFSKLLNKQNNASK